MISPKISKNIQERLKQMNDEVIQSKKNIRNMWIGIAIFSIILLPICYLNQAMIFFIIVVVIAGFIGGGVQNSIIGNKKNTFKTQIVSSLVNQDEELGISYEPQAHITWQEFRYSGIFNSQIDRFKGEDLFTGTRGKTKFKFSEILAEEKHERTDSKGHTSTYYETIFEGIFFVAEFNKKLKGFTRVVEGSDGFFEKLFNGKHKAVLENPRFEKIYNTYSDDQVEARYILTPDMMERILKLKDLFNTKIYYSFRDQFIFIAIHSHQDRFELNTGLPVDEQQVDRIFKEIESVLQVIDILALNTRIWG